MTHVLEDEDLENYEGYLKVTEAAERLNTTPGKVLLLLSHDRIPAVFHKSGVIFIDPIEVAEFDGDANREGYTADDASECLGMTPQNVRRLCRLGKLKADCSGGSWMIDEDDVWRLARENEEKDAKAQAIEKGRGYMAVLDKSQATPRFPDGHWKVNRTS